MLLLLGILKRNNKYYMNVVNTERDCSSEGYQCINKYILNSCVNIKVQRFFSNKQNPTEYLRGEFPLERIIVDDEKLRKRIFDYQIIAIYYDCDNKPCLYKSIDRAGNISIHDISEFEYTKKRSILGEDINNMPEFVEHKNIQDAYEYLNNNKIDESQINSLPVGLVKHYLIGVKGFKEGYHTITNINDGVDIVVQEYMLFKGSSSIKLTELISEAKKVFIVCQDGIMTPFPKERTAGFLTGPIILLGNTRMFQKFCKNGVNTEFTFYNDKAIKLSIPFNKDALSIHDRYIKSKNTLCTWQTGFSTSLTDDIYKNILPNEIFKLPDKLYRDMKKLLYSAKPSTRLENANHNVEMWIYTVALFICWQYFNREFRFKLKPIMQQYHEMYTIALRNLVTDVGPRDTLTVMKWTKEHLKTEMNNILNSDASVVEDNSCLFTFYQNNFDLPECLKVYSEETISIYGGLDKLKKDFNTPNKVKQNFIIKSLETIEKDLQDHQKDLEIKVDITDSLKKLQKI